MDFKKKWHKRTYKTERDSQTLKQTYGCQGEGIVKHFGKVMYTLLYLKWITNTDLLYSTWKFAQCYVPAWMGGGLGKNGYMYMHGWVPLLFTWKYHNIVNWLYPNTKCFWCLKKLKIKNISPSSLLLKPEVDKKRSFFIQQIWDTKAVSVGLTAIVGNSLWEMTISSQSHWPDFRDPSPLGQPCPRYISRALQQMPLIQVTQLKVQSYKIIRVLWNWVSGPEFSINF